MFDLSTKLITEIDGMIKNNPKAFEGAARRLKEKFDQLKIKHSFPIWHTLSSSAKKVCEEGFNNDFDTASSILLIAWMINKKDAELKLLDLSEFNTWGDDGTDTALQGRAYARLLISQYQKWPQLVESAMSVVQGETVFSCRGDVKQQDSGASQNVTNIVLGHVRQQNISDSVVVSSSISQATNEGRKPDDTLFDKVVRWAKNNWFIVVILVVAGILTFLVAVKKNVEDLFRLPPKIENSLKHATQTDFEDLLKDHRYTQIGKLVELIGSLEQEIAGEIDDVCKKFSGEKYSEENCRKLAKEVSESVGRVFEPYFERIGIPEEMKEYAPPAPNPKYKTLADWLEDHEDEKAFMTALITFLEKMLNKQEDTFFSIVDMSKEIRHGIVRKTLVDLLTSPVTKVEILKKTDEKLKILYRKEYKSR